MEIEKQKIIRWLEEEGITCEDASMGAPPGDWAIRMNYRDRNFILFTGGQDWFVLSIGVTISPPHQQIIKSKGNQGVSSFVELIINRCSQMECSFDLRIEETYPVGFQLKYRIFEHGLVKQSLVRYLECLYEVDNNILAGLNTIL